MAAPAIAHEIVLVCPLCRQKVQKLYEDKRTQEAKPVGCLECLKKRFYAREAHAD